MLERAPSGIPGLDEMLQGGFPRRRSILVGGGPGTGKTTFGMQFIYNGAKLYGEKGVFISLEERGERIIEDCTHAFGWDIQGEIQKGNIIVTNVDKFNFQHLVDIVQSAVEQRGVKRVVIDPINILRIFFKDEFEYRRNLFNLFDFLASLNCTTVVTSEKTWVTREAAQFALEEFIVDGVILLYNIPRKNERIFALEILKMRGTKHSRNLYPFQISKEGIVVIPEEIL